MIEKNPKRMKAAFYKEFGPASDVIKIAQLDVPELNFGEVLVRVAASGVNYHDTKTRSGWLGEPLANSRVVPHSDGAGTIVAVAPGGGCMHNKYQIGDSVFFHSAGKVRLGEGSAAEYVAIDKVNVLHLPKQFSFIEGAATCVPAFTAYYAVLADGPVAGQYILVQGGAGAVGSLAIELARWNGAKVIATVSSKEKAEIARKAGADFTINYLHEDVGQVVTEITNGNGVERIIEVDFGQNLETNIKCLRGNGTIASYSSTNVREPVLPYYALAMKGARLQLLQTGNMPSIVREEATKTILALLDRGKLHPQIAETFCLEDTALAHECVESGERIGNVVIDLERSQ